MHNVLAKAIRWHQDGQLEAAVGLYRQVLADAPDNTDALQQLGLALQGLGRRKEAVEPLRRAVQVQPSARAHNSLGCVLRQLGQAGEALTHFQRAVELDPNNHLAQINLGQMLLSLDRPEAALAPCRQAVRLQPDLAVLHLILGDALRCAERFAEARASYLQAVRLQPRLAQAHANLGLLLRAQKKIHQAFAPLQRAIALEPNNASFWKYLAEAHADWEDFGEAIRCWQRALTLQPGQSTLHLGLSSALLEAGRFAEAEEQVRTALRLQPDAAAAQVALGHLHEQLGDTGQAEAAFRAALRLQPAFVGVPPLGGVGPTPPVPEAQLTLGGGTPTRTLALLRLVRLLGRRLPEADQRAIEERLADPQLPEGCRTKLLFALANVLDARGDYGRAVDCARRANALNLAQNRRRKEYVPAEHRRFVDGLIQAFGPDFFRRTAGAGLATERPVFIVGLPRSGTTLVEQILASHRRVHGAGELQLAWQSFMAIPSVLDRDEDVLACVPALGGSAIRRLGEQHLAQLANLGCQSPEGGRADRIIDKMPDNYQYLGLLAALFPRAVFIHCRRDPRDVAVSCWLTHFRWLDWTNDLDHIGARFEEYGRLMEYWRRVLPVTLHEVDYEDIVDDLEGTARRLVAACGLEWDPACLEFHRTRRPVRTTSAAQVRTPIYRQSVGRWKHYEQELADLFARLDSGSLQRP